MSQQQGWGQPPQQPPGWGQPPQQPPGWGQPPQQPPGWGPPPSQPPQWAPPPAGGPGGYSEPKSRPIAIFLALLLGWLGIHRFYVGPVSWGVLYLIFFWTGIPGFLAWLEAIYWLTRSDVEWAQKYGGPVQQSNGCAIGCLWVWALLPLLGLLLVLVLAPFLVFSVGELPRILSELNPDL